MKQAILMSVRGCHSDSLPADLVREGIHFLRKNFPEIPVTLAFEATPRYANLETSIRVYQKSILKKRKESKEGVLYLKEKEIHDLAQVKLLEATLETKTNFVVTDIAEMDAIPLGDPRAKEYQKKREFNMANILRTVIETTGGIIIDFGGQSHITRIEKLIAHHINKAPSFKERLLQTHFYCIYSGDRAMEFPLAIRLMQFGKIDEKAYPLDLKFITTSLGLNDPTPNSFTEIKPKPSEAEKIKEKEEVRKQALEKFILNLEVCAETLQKTIVEKAKPQQFDNRANNNTSQPMPIQSTENIKAITFSAPALSLSSNTSGDNKQNLGSKKYSSNLNTQGSSIPNNNNTSNASAMNVNRP